MSALHSIHRIKYCALYKRHFPRRTASVVFLDSKANLCLCHSYDITAVHLPFEHFFYAGAVGRILEIRGRQYKYLNTHRTHYLSRNSHARLAEFQTKLKTNTKDYANGRWGIKEIFHCWFMN